MFAWFAGVGVGHLALNLGGWIPALVIEDDNMDKDDDQYVLKAEGVDFSDLRLGRE